MPLPAIVGIPFIASVLGSLFTGLITFFAQFVTRRIALLTAAILIITTLTTSFFLALNGLVSATQILLPSVVTQNMGLFLPSNISACITAIATAKTLRWAYDWNVKVVQLKLF